MIVNKSFTRHNHFELHETQRRYRNSLVQRIQELMNNDACINFLLFNILFAYVQIGL